MGRSQKRTKLLSVGTLKVSVNVEITVQSTLDMSTNQVRAKPGTIVFERPGK